MAIEWVPGNCSKPFEPKVSNVVEQESYRQNKELEREADPGTNVPDIRFLESKGNINDILPNESGHDGYGGERSHERH